MLRIRPIVLLRKKENSFLCVKFISAPFSKVVSCRGLWKWVLTAFSYTWWGWWWWLGYLLRWSQVSECLRWSSINVPQPHATLHALVKCNLTHRLEQIYQPPLTCGIAWLFMNEKPFGAHITRTTYHKHTCRLYVQPLPSPNVCMCLCLTQVAAQMRWFTFM